MHHPLLISADLDFPLGAGPPVYRDLVDAVDALLRGEPDHRDLLGKLDEMRADGDEDARLPVNIENVVIQSGRDRKALVRAIPSVAERAGSFHQYGRMSVDELLGDGGRGVQVLEARTLDSMVFLNRGTRFEPMPLPVEAQFSTAFGVSVADWNGDGREDLFLAQNFFGVDAETSRQDAGTGLVLLGDGRGGFRFAGTGGAGWRREGGAGRARGGWGGLGAGEGGVR